jgi:hypothetical protein
MILVSPPLFDTENYARCCDSSMIPPSVTSDYQHEMQNESLAKTEDAVTELQDDRATADEEMGVVGDISEDIVPVSEEHDEPAADENEQAVNGDAGSDEEGVMEPVPQMAQDEAEPPSDPPVAPIAEDSTEQEPSEVLQSGGEADAPEALEESPDDPGDKVPAPSAVDGEVETGTVDAEVPEAEAEGKLGDEEIVEV